MMWLGITGIKKELEIKLSPILQKSGFKPKSDIGGNIGFINVHKRNSFFISFNVLSIGKARMSRMCGYLDTIERILFSINLPDKSIQYYYDKPFKSSYHITLLDNSHYSDKLESETLYSKEDAWRFCDKIIEYMDTRGLVFIEQNNSIEKIYQQIINNWLKGSVEPIVQDTSKYFKALIILRLMKDPNIEDYKSQFSEKLLAYRNPEAWLQSYKNLCDLLDSPDFEKEYLI